MFTGIVQMLGTVAAAQRTRTGVRLRVRPSKAYRSVKLGESFAVNGVCLTVAARAAGEFVFDVIPQTLRVTTLGSLEDGDQVNLERAMRYGDRIGGHYVQGHVEARAKVLAVVKTGREREVRIALPARTADGIVLKGCVAVDGVSLTVSRRSPKAFSVHIIPHTWSATTLKRLSPGDAVNLEGDFLLRGRGTARSARAKKPR